jgi:hypothetical protein
MSQEPATVTYFLEAILTRLEQKLDRLEQKVDERLGRSITILLIRN